MNNLEDYKYIANNLANLAGIPVRLFKNNEQIYICSLINLLKDPLEIDLNNILKLNDEISYYESIHNYYYGIINFNEYKLIIGPTKELENNDQEIKDIAFLLKIPPILYDEFILQIRSIVNFPLMSLLQIMCMVFYAFTERKKTLEDVSIHQNIQENIANLIEETNIKYINNKNENNEIGEYNAFEIENRLLDMVSRGDLNALEEFMKNAPAIRSGKVANDQLRQSKNIFIVTSALISRAAIKGGMDITSSLSLSDAYIQQCELLKNTNEILELQYRMAKDYTEKVSKIKIKDGQSIFVNKVSNYIQKHLSEPIKTDDIAKALFIGRSRLSTDFKKETKINLSDYIWQIKINEAKRLLRYSDKNFTEIALYLGFSSSSHFSKIFKKYSEMTPNEYRALNKHH